MRSLRLFLQMYMITGIFRPGAKPGRPTLLKSIGQVQVGIFRQPLYADAALAINYACLLILDFTARLFDTVIATLLGFIGWYFPHAQNRSDCSWVSVLGYTLETYRTVGRADQRHAKKGPGS